MLHVICSVADARRLWPAFVCGGCSSSLQRFSRIGVSLTTGRKVFYLELGNSPLKAYFRFFRLNDDRVYTHRPKWRWEGGGFSLALFEAQLTLYVALLLHAASQSLCSKSLSESRKRAYFLPSPFQASPRRHFSVVEILHALPFVSHSHAPLSLYRVRSRDTRG